MCSFLTNVPCSTLPGSATWFHRVDLKCKFIKSVTLRKSGRTHGLLQRADYVCTMGHFCGAWATKLEMPNKTTVRILATCQRSQRGFVCNLGPTKCTLQHDKTEQTGRKNGSRGLQLFLHAFNCATHPLSWLCGFPPCGPPSVCRLGHGCASEMCLKTHQLQQNINKKVHHF